MNSPELNTMELASQNRAKDEFIKHGATLIQDPGTERPRLHLTDDQLVEAQTINQIKTVEKGASKELSPNDFLEWTQIHQHQFLSFVIEQYGSLEEFQRRAGLRAEYRIQQMAQDSENPSVETPKAA
jgi:hypothetical protein